MPDSPRYRPVMAANAPWLLRGTPACANEMVHVDDGERELSAPLRAPQPAVAIAAPLPTVADRVQDVARRLTDDFVNGRTDMRFNTFQSRSRILWRRVARLRRAHRVDLLS